MSDESIAARIERLVSEEHELRDREQADSPDPAALGEDTERLRAVEVGRDRCWAVLDLYITNATNGIKFTQLERQHLKSIRYQPAHQPLPEEVTAA